jgi:hypothetical protein
MTMESSKGQIEQIETTRSVEDEFDSGRSPECIDCQKSLSFLVAAGTDTGFRAEILAFVAEVKAIFERSQLAEDLEAARQTVPFDPGACEGEDPEGVEAE